MKKTILPALFVLLCIFVAFLAWDSHYTRDIDVNAPPLQEAHSISASDSKSVEILSEMLIHFSSRREGKWLPYNVSGYEEGFEGIVSNGTENFKVAVFVYRNLSECLEWFENLEKGLNSSFSVVNSSESESCVWRLFSGNKSYYIECSRFWGRGVLLVVKGSSEKAVERLTWWFPTQSCLRPGTKLVVQTGSPK